MFLILLTSNWMRMQCNLRKQKMLRKQENADAVIRRTVGYTSSTNAQK